MTWIYSPDPQPALDRADRRGRSSFPLVIVILQLRSARDTTGDTETDPEHRRKTCDWKSLMPKDLPASLLLPSHPKTCLPTNPKQELQCGIRIYLSLCMWFLQAHPVSITKLSPDKLPCRRLFPSCSDELQEWGPCRDRKSSQAKSVTDFKVVFRAI